MNAAYDIYVNDDAHATNQTRYKMSVWPIVSLDRLPTDAPKIHCYTGTLDEFHAALPADAVKKNVIRLDDQRQPLPIQPVEYWEGAWKSPEEMLR